ncbi:MAG: hypothetical protein KME43_09685 [Myxacorys chilensis ATA2-1-KO14]|jgi:hypothetical protein|nr:hypothetical protein [Myxacorys chilensis ATA2-1-KO14]
MQTLAFQSLELERTPFFPGILNLSIAPQKFICDRHDSLIEVIAPLILGLEYSDRVALAKMNESICKA